MAPITFLLPVGAEGGWSAPSFSLRSPRSLREIGILCVLGARLLTTQRHRRIERRRAPRGENARDDRGQKENYR